MSRVSGLAVYVIQWRGEISNFNNHKKYISREKILACLVL